MATDATGTPSTLAIPKYNTAADKPSGKGLNAIVDAIDTLLAARITKATLTTTGDTFYASSANTPARLAIGSTNQVLGVTGGIPAWLASLQSLMTATGDTLYASSANTPARLAVGATGTVVTVAGGVPTWAIAPGTLLAYAEQTSNVSITGTTSGTATAVVSAGAYTFDGTAVWVEVNIPGVVKGTTNCLVELYEDATNKGQIYQTTSAVGVQQVFFRRKYTPAAGSKTIAVKGYVDAGTGTVQAGSGGAGTSLPIYISITKA